MRHRTISRRSLLRGTTAIGGLTGLAALGACGEPTVAEAGADPEAAAGEAAQPRESTDRSIATGKSEGQHLVLTGADAGQVIETEYFVHDIGLPDQKGTEIMLGGDDASTLRWRWAQKPDTFVMEWHAVNGQPAFETDGLIGNPAAAAKVLELRGLAEGETVIVLELVERDPAQRQGQPAKRLEYTFDVTGLAPGGHRSDPNVGSWGVF